MMIQQKNLLEKTKWTFLLTFLLYSITIQAQITEKVLSEIDVKTIESETDLHDITFTSENKGFIVGEKGKLAKTENAGNSWTVESLKTRKNLNAIYFETPTKGWIAGDNGLVLSTEDGGQTWKKRGVSTRACLYDISKDEDGKIWITGTSGTLLSYDVTKSKWVKHDVSTNATLYTVNIKTNGTASAYGEEVYLSADNLNESTSSQIYTGSTKDATGVILSTQSGDIIKHEETEVQTILSNNTKSYNDITKYDATLLIVGTEGTLDYSLDNGDDWSDAMVQTSKDLNETTFSTENTGWAVGDEGTVVKLSFESTANTVNSRLSQEDNSISNFELEITPNPTSHRMQIITNQENYNIIIRDALGKLVLEDTSTDLKKIISVTDYAPGMYFVTIQKNATKITKRVVVTRTK